MPIKGIIFVCGRGVSNIKKEGYKWRKVKNEEKESMKYNQKIGRKIKKN